MHLDLKALAKRGAEIRLAELKQEETAIRKQFRIAVSAIPSDTPTRTRKPMTAAQKREVSRRMTKYWADRRKANKGK